MASMLGSERDSANQPGPRFLSKRSAVRASKTKPRSIALLRRIHERRPDRGAGSTCNVESAFLRLASLIGFHWLWWDLIVRHARGVGAIAPHCREGSCCWAKLHTCIPIESCRKKVHMERYSERSRGLTL